MATKLHLARYNPVQKFFAVKMVVFMTYWQMLFIKCIPGYTEEEKAAVNNIILCIEMLGFAFYHAKAFPYSDFMQGVPDRDVLKVNKYMHITISISTYIHL